MDYSKYTAFTVQDFLDDDLFVNWAVCPDAAQNQFWQTFISIHPEKEKEVTQANRLIKAYRLQYVADHAENQAAVWERIETSIRSQNQLQPRKVLRFSPILRIAAVLFLLCSTAAAFWFFNSKEVVTTSFGQIKNVVLPDHSVVVLNSNSSLAYYPSWGTHSRQVWLTGEALFTIKHLNRSSRHIKPAERFFVHSNVDIEVLGTTFNVKSRRNNTNVSLLKGKIKVEYLNTFSKVKESGVMQPGDNLEFNDGGLVARKVLAQPAKVILWTSRQLVFNNPYLYNIIQTLQDEYGYQIALNDPELKNLKIEGEIKVPNVKQLLETVSAALHLKISQSGKIITITKVKTPK